MSEAYDYAPAPQWRGHDFGKAKDAYDRHVGSAYDDAKRSNVKASALIEKSITTKAQRPLVIVVDETGSMGKWPATMFSKLPYLDHEVRWYLGDDAEICFMAIGDAQNREDYPLQVQPFASGTDLTTCLNKLVIEGQGGNNNGETYELAALYLAHNMHVDPMADPIVIFIGDECFMDTISVDHAANYSQVKLERPITGTHAFKELQDKATVYFIQKPYGRPESGNAMTPMTREVHEKWGGLLGVNHIAMLSDPDRVVDVIFGILAAEVDRLEEFHEEIEGRQTDAQVKVVYKSLETIHAISVADRAALESGKSVMINRGNSGDASTPLLGQ